MSEQKEVSKLKLNDIVYVLADEALRGTVLSMQNDLNKLRQGFELYKQNVTKIIESVKEFVGTPLKAGNKKEMSNENKIYVYIGSESGMTFGHWYYYNGTAWADGGVYNDTAVEVDTTLRASGKAADANSVGLAIDELNTNISARLESVESEIEKLKS